MKKYLLLLVLFPAFIFAQNPLVKWFNADYSATTLSQTVTAKPIKAKNVSLSNEIWGSSNVFYATGGWPQPNYSNPGVSSFDGSKYIEFTVTAKSGYQITMAGFTMNARMQGDTGRLQIRYSKLQNFSNSKVLQAETVVSATYKTFSLNFAEPVVVGSEETLYVRVYVYNTNHSFHIQHNLSGTIAPYFTGTVNLEVPVPPVVNDEFIGTEKNNTITVEVDHSSNQYSGPISAINIVTPPLHGSVQVNGVSSLKYTPAAGFTGFDQFYYSLTNAVGLSNVAKVDVQVIDGNEQVLTRWKNANFFPTDLAVTAAGKEFTVVNQTLRVEPNVEGTTSPAFAIGGLATPQEFNGFSDGSKYSEFAISALGPDHSVLVKKLMMKYRGAGTGNITIKYSKTADFSGTVHTLVDDETYGTPWTGRTLALSSGVFLYPGEQLFFRIYTYNTNNEFFIEMSDAAGMALSGIVAPYTAPPCQTVVTWTTSGWIGGTPTINKKVVIKANYNTATHGALEACTLTVNNGELTVSPGSPLTVQNSIHVDTAAALVVLSDANIIQINDASAANTGNITALRDIKISAGRSQYNYLGSPVNFAPNENLKTIYKGITFALYYNEANNYFYNSSGANVPGRGLAVKEPIISADVPEGAKTVTAAYKGIPQNGVITFPLANSSTTTNTSLGYNLLGNPYPSNIDLISLYQLNSQASTEDHAQPISSTFYLWDSEVNIEAAQQGSSYSGQAYAVFNSAAGSRGTGTSAAGYLANNIIGRKTPSAVIKVGQGFMVKAQQKNYTLKFNNSVRTPEDAEFVFLGKGENSAQPDDRYWLTMVAPSNIGSTMAVVYFSGGKSGIGAEDSESRGGSDELFSLVATKNLAINGKDSFTDSDVIALGSRHFASGIHTIALDKAEGKFVNGHSVYLKDNQTGIITNLSLGSYSFMASAGESTGRFEISYKPSAVLATDSVNKEELVVYKDSSDFVIKAKTKKITGLQVFDASGRLSFAAQPNSRETVISSEKLTSGLYILKITQDGDITTKKIIK